MPSIRKLVLDVLKPRLPNAPEFASAIAAVGDDYRVRLCVEEIDENTVTTSVTIEGRALDYAGIERAIKELGGAVHSVDEVEVVQEPEAPE